MSKKADRYTVIEIHINDIPEKLTAIRSLDLHWFIVRPTSPSDTTCQIYVFFDSAGLNNYLSGMYDPVQDSIRRVLRDDLSVGDAIEQIKGYLDY